MLYKKNAKFYKKLLGNKRKTVFGRIRNKLLKVDLIFKPHDEKKKGTLKKRILRVNEITHDVIHF